MTIGPDLDLEPTDHQVETYVRNGLSEDEHRVRISKTETSYFAPLGETEQTTVDGEAVPRDREVVVADVAASDAVHVMEQLAAALGYEVTPK